MSLSSHKIDLVFVLTIGNLAKRKCLRATLSPDTYGNWRNYRLVQTGPTTSGTYYLTVQRS